MKRNSFIGLSLSLALSASLYAGDLKSTGFEIPDSNIGYALKDAASLNMRNIIFLKNDVDAIMQEVNEDKKMIIGNQTSIGGLRQEDELLKKKLNEIVTKLDAIELKMSLIKTGMSQNDQEDLKVMKQKMEAMDKQIENLQGGAVKPDYRIKVDQKLLDYVKNKK